MASPTLDNLKDMLNELKKSDYTVRLMRSRAHSSIDIQISHMPTNTYQIIRYDDHHIQSQWNKAPLEILDRFLDEIALTAMGSRAFDIKPRYWRVFDGLMHQLFYSEFKPGNPFFLDNIKK